MRYPPDSHRTSGAKRKKRNNDQIPVCTNTSTSPCADIHLHYIYFDRAPRHCRARRPRCVAQTFCSFGRKQTHAASMSKELSKPSTEA